MLVALCLATGAVAAEPADQEPSNAVRVLRAERIDQTAPVFSLVDMNGESLRLEELRGHPVVLHFWATWCEPCRRELPLLAALAHTLPAEARVIAISIDETEPTETVAAWAPTSDAAFSVALARDGDVSAHYWAFGVPVTYLVDRQGELRYRLRGNRDWADAKAAAALTALLE